MKRRDYALFTFSGGLILLVIQFLIIISNTINGIDPLNEMVFVYVESITFVDFITAVWSSFLGTLLLIALYIRRFMKGRDALLVLVGALLWLIQLLNLYDSAYDLKKFILTYIIGIIGIALIVITGFWEAYAIKRYERAEDSND